MVISLYITLCFSLAVFRIPFLYLIFDILIWYVFVWIILLGTLFASYTWISVSLFRFGKFQL